MITNTLDPNRVYHDSSNQPLEFGRVYSVDSVHGIKVPPEARKDMEAFAVWTGNMLIDSDFTTWNPWVDPGGMPSPALTRTDKMEIEFAERINAMLKKKR